MEVFPASRIPSPVRPVRDIGRSLGIIHCTSKSKVRKFLVVVSSSYQPYLLDRLLLDFGRRRDDFGDIGHLTEIDRSHGGCSDCKAEQGRHRHRNVVDETHIDYGAVHRLLFVARSRLVTQSPYFSD